MKKRIIQIITAFLAGVLLCSNTVMGEESKRPEYTYVTVQTNREESEGEDYYSEDGKYELRYVSPADVNYKEVDLEAGIKNKRAANTAEKFFLDGSNDYGYSYYEIAGMDGQKTLYVRIHDLLSEVYQSNSDIQLTDFGNFSEYCVGKVAYGDLGLESDEELMKVYISAMNDHPLAFYMSGTILYGGGNLYLIVEEDFATGSVRNSYNANIQNMIIGYCDKLTNTFSNYAFAKEVHDTIIHEMDYAYEADGMTPQNNPYVHSIAGYVSGNYKLVCDGYTETYSAILNYYDIANIIVTGWGVPEGSTTTDADGHAWNMVRFGNGEYYFVDVTWDDGGDWGPRMDYFGIGQRFYDTHSITWKNEVPGTGVHYQTPLPSIPAEDFTGEDTLDKVADPTYDGGHEEKPEETRPIAYTYNNGVLTFSGDGAIVQPEECVDGEWCKYRDSTTKLVFEEGITSIGNFAFMNFPKVTEISFPDSLQGLGQEVFAGCNSLKEVKIPDNIIFLGPAFDNCEALEKVTFGTMPELGGYLTPMFAGCKALKEIVVPEENPTFEDKDGVLFDKNSNSLITYPANKAGKYYEIPDTTKTLSVFAFDSAQNVEKLVIPESVKYIDCYAFNGCMKLQSLTIPASYAGPSPGLDIDTVVSACQILNFVENKSNVPIYFEQMEGYNQIYGYGNERVWMCWKNKETGEFIKSIANGTAVPHYFGFLMEGDTFTQNGITYQVRKLYYDGEPPYEDVLAKKPYGRVEVVSAMTTTFPKTITYYGWKWDVTVPSGCPKAPSSVSATLYGYDDVKVSWSKVSGAKSYAVSYKKDGAKTFTDPINTNNTSYKFSNLADGVKYIFKVTPCYGAAEKLSIYSKNAEVYTLKSPGTPSISKASSKTITVKWNNISGESGYQLSKSTSKTGTNIVSTLTAASKTMTVTTNQTYYYKVRAYKTVGNTKIYGPWSAVKSYNLRYVGALSGFTTKLTAYNTVKMTWKKTIGANKYYVYCKKLTDKEYKLLGTTTNLFYSKKGLVAGTEYNFKVEPAYVNNGTVLKGNSLASKIITLKKVASVGIKQVSSTRAKVTWENINGETGYQISCSTSKSKNGILTTYQTTSGGSKTLSVKKGTTYYYKVRAYKTVGTTKIYGPWSDIVSFKTK